MRKVERAKSRMEKKTAVEKVSEVTPELPKESPAAMSDAPIVTSAPKWRVKVSSTSVPKLLLNLKTSAPKWVPARTASSTLNSKWFKIPRGNRCASKIGLQVDHVCPVSFGQDNRLENLRLLCRQCNIALAEEILGTAVMERYRWIKSRKGDEATY